MSIQINYSLDGRSLSEATSAEQNEYKAELLKAFETEFFDEGLDFVLVERYTNTSASEFEYETNADDYPSLYEEDEDGDMIFKTSEISSRIDSAYRNAWNNWLGI